MKRLQPIDSLTEQDKYNIRKYIYLYTNCNCGPLDIVLREWNKSKRRLYHAFGNKLRIKKTIKLDRNKQSLARELSQIYIPYTFYSKNDLSFRKQRLLMDKTQSMIEQSFYSDFFLYIVDYPNLSADEKINIMSLFNYDYIISGYLNIDFKLQHYNFSVRRGAKTIRTIQKCLKALGYSNIELFNKWRNDINTINSNQLNEVTLVLSINPIDYMTMSDNQCNWTSCMSWISPGCHSAGTIEMMNSNVAIVAYLEAKKNFKIVLDENNKLIMPNKSWRSLIFCHKQLLLVGKSYPYYRKDISIEALNFLREVVKESFNWNYQFINQKYKDIKNFYNNDFLKYYCVPNYHHGSKKIITYTNGMYNDMIEDTSSPYWCCRNVTKGIRINLSGKNTCMCCGEVIDNDNYYEDYDEGYLLSEKICEYCSKENKCPICGVINYSTDNKYHLCSNECKEDALIFPGQNSIISRTEFLSKTDKTFFIFSKNKKVFEDIYSKLYDYRGDKIFYTGIDNFLKDLGYIKGRDYLLKEVPTVLIKKHVIEYLHADYKSLNKISTALIFVINMIRDSPYFYWATNRGVVFNHYSMDLLNELINLEYYRYKERRG